MPFKLCLCSLCCRCIPLKHGANGEVVNAGNLGLIRGMGRRQTVLPVLESSGTWRLVRCQHTCEVRRSNAKSTCSSFACQKMTNITMTTDEESG